jgi:hypothetical protein
MLPSGFGRAALGALLALSACVPGPAVRRVDPGFTGVEFCVLEGNVLDPGDLRLDLERSDSATREPSFQLLLDQLGAREMVVREEEPLRVSLGADSLLLQPAGIPPERRVLHGEFVLTRWRYLVTGAQLDSIASATAGEVAIPSTLGVVRARLTPASRAAVKGFLTKCSSGATVAPGAGPVRAGVSDPWIPVNEQEFTTMPSGLRYKDEVVGTGVTAKAGDRVSVQYTGWLEDGTKFDSSRDRNQPFEFQLGAGSVIRGWDDGVQGMRVGGRRRLVIPPELGYGARAVGGVIPANSTLVFEVELLSVR